MEENVIKEKSNFRKLLDFVLGTSGWLILFLVIFKLVLFVGRVPTESMNSTILPQSTILGQSISLRLGGKVDRYDVVVFKDEDETYIVKRVIGLPGDTVEIKEDGVFVNGEKTIDEFVRETPMYNKVTYEVPEGKYFMLGDNRNHSYDSRYWADPFLDRDKMVAKIYFNLKGFNARVLKSY